MFKIIPFLALFCLTNLSSQTVFEIIWEEGANGHDLNSTIEVGDVVTWTWSDAAAKSITSLPRGKEFFDSGVLEEGNKFSHKFTQVGVTSYENEVNPDLKGKITVEPKLSSEDKFLKNLKFYPNPVTSHLNLSSAFIIDKYEIYNALGNLVMQGMVNSKTKRIALSSLNSGLYFVKVYSSGVNSTLKITKI